MVERALGNAVVVGRKIVRQRGLQLLSRLESGLRDDLADAPVEALHHAIGLRMTRRTQSVLDAQFHAAPVEGMLTAWCAGLAREAVCELTAVVGQHSLDFHRRGLVQTAQKVDAGGLILVCVDAQVDPACGPVDGHKQIAPGLLVGHLRQVLDVHMNKARLVVFERLRRDRLVARQGGLYFAQAAHTVTLQAAIQARTGHLRIDELARDNQQVVQWQEQHSAQFDNDRLLARRERGAQLAWPVRQVFGRLPRLPFASRRHGDVVALSQLSHRRCRGLDLGPRSRCRAGLRVNLTHALASCRSDSITPRSVSLALNKAQLRAGI